MQIPPLIQLLAAWLGFVALIWTVFDSTEKILTTDARRSLANWLKNVKPEEGSQAWVQIFTAILDRVFGTEIFSRKAFSRSCIASTIALTLMASIYLLNAKSPLINLSAAPSLILIWVFACFFVDYVSLCESRGVISEMSKVGTGGVVLLLIGDFILTVSIFIVAASFVLTTVQEIGDVREVARIVDATIEDPYNEFDVNDPQDIEKIKLLLALTKGIEYAADFTLKGLRFWRAENASAIFGMFFFSTFVTSVWVWLYAIGGLFIKAVQYLGFGTGKLRRWLDIENQPMLAIGYVCMMLVTLGFILVLIF